MSRLQTCTELWGGADILEEDPSIVVVRDGAYLPYDHGGRWGIFDRDGGIVSAATDFRAGQYLSHAQRIDPSAPADTIPDQAPDGTYIYGGYVNVHFGHYLINSLPRLWAIARLRTPSTKILCHACSTPEAWFSVPFIGTILAALGLTPRDFIVLRQPMRLRCLVVPSTSLREQSAGHRVYAQFCRELGERIAPGRGRTGSGPPIYYSKARLGGAVGLIENEAEIEAVMREAGIDIVYPELLSLADQIRVMSERTFLVGTSGSFFHSSLFCPPRRVVCLNYTAQINSNYTIVDRLTGNKASYHYPPALRTSAGRSGILTARYLPDARAVGLELLERVEAAGGKL